MKQDVANRSLKVAQTHLLNYIVSQSENNLFCLLKINHV